MIEGNGFILRNDDEIKGQEARDKADEQFQTSREAEKSRNQDIPPIDFSGFVLGLGQMALVHLGAIPELHSGKIEKDLAQARHTIDILDMLQEKTKGNLEPGEEKLIQGLENELKLKYVKALKSSSRS